MNSTVSPVRLIRPKRHEDARGWFTEVYSTPAYADMGIGCAFVQDNHSMSASIFTLRGLHFQKPAHAQDKLVRCVRGRIFDVAVDLRRDSPTYAEWVGAELSADNGFQLFIPVGFAHGFVTLEENCEVIYKCSNIFAPTYDSGILWSSVGIAWPIPHGIAPELSEKDKNQTILADFDSPFPYCGNALKPLS